jgi:hypothetical protein
MNEQISLRNIEKQLSELAPGYEVEWSKQFCPIMYTKSEMDVNYDFGGQVIITAGMTKGVDCNDLETPEDASCKYVSVNSKAFKKPQYANLPAMIRTSDSYAQLVNSGNDYWYQIFERDESKIPEDVARLMTILHQYSL